MDYDIRQAELHLKENPTDFVLAQKYWKLCDRAGIQPHLEAALSNDVTSTLKTTVELQTYFNIFNYCYHFTNQWGFIFAYDGLITWGNKQKNLTDIKRYEKTLHLVKPAIFKQKMGNYTSRYNISLFRSEIGYVMRILCDTWGLDYTHETLEYPEHDQKIIYLVRNAFI